jgi:hypothetical protein
LTLSASQCQVDIQQGFFGGLLRRQRLFDLRQNSCGLFRAARNEESPRGTEQILVAIRATILSGQRFVHAGSAHLVPLTGERIGVVQ